MENDGEGLMPRGINPEGIENPQEPVQQSTNNVPHESTQNGENSTVTRKGGSKAYVTWKIQLQRKFSQDIMTALRNSRYTTQSELVRDLLDDWLKAETEKKRSTL